jgi:hypothetical protein
VLLEGQKKRRTKAQVAEDKSRALEAQAAKEAALQRGIDRIAGIEAAMQVEQVAEATSRAKPVKPRARPVKKKEKRQDETNEDIRDLEFSGSVRLGPSECGSVTSYAPLIISYFNHHRYHAFSRPPGMCSRSLDFYSTCKFLTLHVSHKY